MPSPAPEGSVARPYRQTLWNRIAEVHWVVGAATVVEVTAPETKFYDVVSLTPDLTGYDFFSGGTIAEADYRDKYVIEMAGAASTGSVVTEDELTDVWVWDGFNIGTNCAVVFAGSPGLIAGCEEDNATAVSNGTATFGYAPIIHLVGQQVALNQQTPPFGVYSLGNVVEHTHPNGTTVRYRSGYTALSHGPQYDSFGEPFGDFDYINTESWYWYRVTTRPGQTAAILRKSYLVDFRTNFVQLAELRDFESALDAPLEWSIKGYPAGTAFTVADGRMTPVGGVAPRYSASGSSAGGHGGTIRKFNASGFVP